MLVLVPVPVPDRGDTHRERVESTDPFRFPKESVLSKVTHGVSPHGRGWAAGGGSRAADRSCAQRVCVGSPIQPTTSGARVSRS